MIKKIIVGIGAFGGAVLVSTVVFGAFNGPTDVPPNPAGEILSALNGNLGVDNANPGFKLDVSGDANATRLCIAGDCKNSWSAVGGGAFWLQSVSQPATNIYTTKNVGIGAEATSGYALDVWGSFAATVKNFDIPHPLDPLRKRLVHSTLEGPEIAVYYRGEAKLSNGIENVILPSYFEALTRKEGRTILLTPKFSGSEPISNLAASEVVGGKFSVRTIDGANPNQEFYWEVKAVRADQPALDAERWIEK